ncbi:MAG: cytochrome c biogenesis protein ResB, partial [Crocinitomicaceae bacterium]
MEKILRKFFSIEMMTLGLLTFLISIARATFIESDYGTQASKAVVYNTWWFETLLVYLGINLIVNIFRYKMFKKEKIAVLSFHVAFILILIGAGVTRYISFEGIMPIREGSQSNTIYSNDGYLQVLAHDNTTQYEMSKRLYLADIANNNFSVKFNKPNTDKKVEIDYSNFIPNAVDKLIKNAPDGTVVLEIVIPGPRGMDTNYVAQGSYFEKNGFLLSFDYPNPPAGSVQITQSPNGFEMFSTAPIQYMQMSDKARGVIPADTLYTFYQGRLYTINGNNFVFKTFHRKAKLVKVKSPEKEMGKDILYVTLKS